MLRVVCWVLFNAPSYTLTARQFFEVLLFSFNGFSMLRMPNLFHSCQLVFSRTFRCHLHPVEAFYPSGCPCSPWLIERNTDKYTSTTVLKLHQCAAHYPPITRQPMRVAVVQIALLSVHELKHCRAVNISIKSTFAGKFCALNRLDGVWWMFRRRGTAWKVRTSKRKLSKIKAPLVPDGRCFLFYMKTSNNSLVVPSCVTGLLDKLQASLSVTLG